MSENYKVGYGKPPKAHQWQPGQSGNPSGKKAKTHEESDAKSFQDLVAEELLEHVSPTVDGKKQRMRSARAIAKAIVRDLMTGEPKDKILILRELKSLGIFHRFDALIREATFDAETDSTISVEERLMLEALNEALGDEESKS